MSCRASGGGTMLLSDQGHVYAAGVNRQGNGHPILNGGRKIIMNSQFIIRYNRLGLDETRALLLTRRVERALVPTRVKSLKGAAVVEVNMTMTKTLSICMSIMIIGGDGSEPHGVPDGRGEGDHLREEQRGAARQGPRALRRRAGRRQGKLSALINQAVLAITVQHLCKYPKRYWKGSST